MSDVPGPGHPLASHANEVRRRLRISRDSRKHGGQKPLPVTSSAV